MRLTILFILASAAFAQPKLVPSGTVVSAGSAATLTLTLVGGGANPAALQVSVSLPAGAVVVPGPGLTAAGKSLYQNTVNGTALLLVAWDGVTPAGAAGLIPDGVIASINFTAGAPYTFVLSNPLAASSAAAAVVITASNFSFKNPCDLNSDGVLDLLDLRNMIDQIDKVVACTTGDLNADVRCDVLDAQRLINALAGGACVIGK